MSLTVGYDVTAAVRQGAGIGRYTRELLRGLARRDDPFYFRLYSAGGKELRPLPPLDGRFRMRPLPLSDRTLNLVWHRMRVPLPVQLITGRIDLFHSPDFTLPPTLGAPSVLTVHDLAFLTVPGCAYPTLRQYLERVVPRSVRRADHIIAVSESTRTDIINYLGADPDRVTTILEGVEPQFQPVADQVRARMTIGRLGVDGPYILSVGTLEPRKNYTRLFEAYAILRQRGLSHRLVVAGKRGWLYEPALRRLRELGLTRWVSFVQPGDEALIALYGMADAFVYPSLYEGFGIPPLEALACGAPVACSNTSSLPEVVNGAALTFDPLDVEAMANSIERLLSDAGLRSQLQSEGLERARALTWDRTAEETVSVYRKVGACA